MLEALVAMAVRLPTPLRRHIRKSNVSTHLRRLTATEKQWTLKLLQLGVERNAPVVAVVEVEAVVLGELGRAAGAAATVVSYTHLTLPTIYSV